MTKEIAKVKVKKTPKVVGLQAVMPSASELRKQMTRDKGIREVINEFITASLVKDIDFGAIKGKSKTGASFEGKPTLLKPGAEKICGLFKIRPTFRKDTDTWEMLGSKPGTVAYICELVNTSGIIVGEGRGTATAEAGDYGINKAVKIGEKRAQIDAVLRTGALSDFFTQDMEDAPKEFTNTGSKKYGGSQSKPVSDKQRAFIMRMLKNRKVDNVLETIIANGIADPKSMTSAQASDFIEKLTADDFVRVDKPDDIDPQPPEDSGTVEVNGELVDLGTDTAAVFNDEPGPEKPEIEEVAVRVTPDFVQDVMTKIKELGLNAQASMRLYKDATGAPYAPKTDAHWIAVDQKLDEMADARVTNGK